MATLDILCPECGANYCIGEEMRGAKVECAECGTKFFIYEDGSVRPTPKETNVEKRFGRDDPDAPVGETPAAKPPEERQKAEEEDGPAEWKPAIVAPSLLEAAASVKPPQQPQQDTIANATSLDKEAVAPFVFQHAPSYNPAEVEQLCEAFWNSPSEDLKTTIRAEKDGVYIVLSKASGSPTAIGAAFPLNASGWISIPSEIIARMIKPDKPATWLLRESLKEFYRNISSELGKRRLLVGRGRHCHQASRNNSKPLPKPQV